MLLLFSRKKNRLPFIKKCFPIILFLKQYHCPHISPNPFITYLNHHTQILWSGGDEMTQEQTSDLRQQQQQQNAKGRSAEEQKQDIKNAEYIARIGQPNHPNT